MILSILYICTVRVKNILYICNSNVVKKFIESSTLSYCSHNKIQFSRTVQYVSCTRRKFWVESTFRKVWATSALCSSGVTKNDRTPSELQWIRAPLIGTLKKMGMSNRYSCSFHCFRKTSAAGSSLGFHSLLSHSRLTAFHRLRQQYIKFVSLLDFISSVAVSLWLKHSFITNRRRVFRARLISCLSECLDLWGNFFSAGFKVHELRRKSKGDLLNQVCLECAPAFSASCSSIVS